jgi:hypothetical protein
MAQRLHFQNSNEVGVFAMLSNAYCLCTLGTSENFVRASARACFAVDACVSVACSDSGRVCGAVASLLAATPFPLDLCVLELRV